MLLLTSISLLKLGRGNWSLPLLSPCSGLALPFIILGPLSGDFWALNSLVEGAAGSQREGNRIRLEIARRTGWEGLLNGVHSIWFSWPPLWGESLFCGLGYPRSLQSYFTWWQWKRVDYLIIESKCWQFVFCLVLRLVVVDHTEGVCIYIVCFNWFVLLKIVNSDTF